MKINNKLESFLIFLMVALVGYIFIYLWGAFTALAVGLPVPPFFQAFAYLEQVVAYRMFSYLGIGLLYIMAIALVPLSIYLRYTIFKWLILVPIWLFASIVVGNFGYSLINSSWISFSIFQPTRIIFGNNYIDTTAWAFLAISYLGAMALIGCCIYFLLWKKIKDTKDTTTGKHGTAKQADLKYLQQKNLIIPYSDTQPNWIALAKKKKKYIGIEKLDMFRHTMVIAPTRLGKTVGIAIPRILDSIDSCFILDLKSELFQTTYQESIRKGKTPIALDPYNVLSRYGNFPNKYIIKNMNPLNPKYLNIEDEFIKDEYIDSLVSSLTSEEKYESKHFKETAEAILGALIEDNLPVESKVGSLVDLYYNFASAGYDEVIYASRDA